MPTRRRLLHLDDRRRRHDAAGNVARHRPADGTDTSATFEFTGTDDVASAADPTFTCTLDGVSEPCASPKTYTGLAIGDHTFLVRAVDAAGNVDPTAEVHEWTIEVPDTTAPETTIVESPAATTTSTAASFEFEAIDNPTQLFEGEFECRLDGLDSAPWETCASPKSYSGLSLGQHTFEVRATDAAGNTDATPASFTWTIQEPPDTTAPETTIGDRPPLTTTATSASFTFTSNEPGVTFECALDGAEFAACPTPYDLTNLSGGAHELLVRARDAANNVDATPASFQWTVDLPPDTTIENRPTDPTAATTASFTFSASETGSTFECALDDAGFSSCASPIELSELAVGEHTFTVRAKDADRQPRSDAG